MNVSAGELLGLALVVGVLTGVSVALIVPYWVARLHRSVAHHEHRLAAFHRWLDARNALSRSSKDFVTTFRGLDSDETDAVLRRAEAARTMWLAASREWERATAQLLVWCDHPELGATVRQFEQPDAQAVRAAIGKSAPDVARLFKRLDDLDAMAVAMARTMVRKMPSWWWRRLRHADAFLRRITNNWSRPG